MPVCKKCGQYFPYKKKIDGKTRVLKNRKFCLECSPFGQHNTKDITIDTVTCQQNLQEIRQRDIAKVTKKRNENMRRAIEYKGGKCIICGYNRCSRALSFHHIDPETKSFPIAQSYTLSWERLRKELDKCALLCSNCHMEVEEGITQLPI